MLDQNSGRLNPFAAGHTGARYRREVQDAGAAGRRVDRNQRAEDNEPASLAASIFALVPFSLPTRGVELDAATQEGS